MLAALASAPLSALNVYGDELALCSKPGMAMTGFTRDGHCTDLDDGAGSHHICIQMWPSKVNFCNQTGQPDWCEEEMPCHEDASKTCPIKNWCVCQWAFEAYEKKGGLRRRRRPAVRGGQQGCAGRLRGGQGRAQGGARLPEAKVPRHPERRQEQPHGRVVAAAARASRHGLGGVRDVRHGQPQRRLLLGRLRRRQRKVLLVATDGCQSDRRRRATRSARLLSTTSRLLSTTAPRRSTRWCWSRGARGRARGGVRVRDVRSANPSVDCYVRRRRRRKVPRR